MTINLTAYETTAGRGHKTQPVIDALQVALLRSFGESEENAEYRLLNHINPHLIFVDNNELENKDIPVFVHPITVSFKNETRVVVDMRYFTSKPKDYGSLRGSVSMRSQPEYELHTMRGLLNQHWIENAGKGMLIFNPVPMIAFASWLQGAISSRLSLDVQEKHLLRILCAYFYYCQFSDEVKWGQMEQHSMVGYITRNLRVTPEDVIALVGDLEVIRDLTMFCDVVRDRIDSVRLKDLTPGLVVAVIAGTWFGTNSREIVATALEHPPTWMALVYTSISNRVFRNTDIAKRVAMVIGRNDAKMVLQSYKSLLKID